jgi:deoxyadenosine/deoxycytidine kinase
MKIDVEYFKRLRKAYDRFFVNMKGVHLADADRFDCINDERAVAGLNAPSGVAGLRSGG